MKTLKLALLLALVAVAAFAQSSSVQLIGNPPMASSLTATVTGAPGSTVYYYWVVAVYTGGKAAPAGPLLVANSNATLSSTNFNAIAFATPTAALSAPTGYDLLRTTTQTVPTGSCACAVSTAQSGSPINDQSNTLSGYTVATHSVVYQDYIDAISSAVPARVTYTSIDGATAVSTVTAANSVYSVEGTLTVAALNTGSVIVPGIAGHTMKLLGAAIQVIGGTVATCTNIDFGDSAFANPKFRFLSAGTLAVGVTYSDGSAAAFVTTGTGTALNAAFGAGLGIGLQSNGGGTCTTATSINYRAYYKVL